MMGEDTWTIFGPLNIAQKFWIGVWFKN
jgi:hypothetical protein